MEGDRRDFEVMTRNFSGGTEKIMKTFRIGAFEAEI